MPTHIHPLEAALADLRTALTEAAGVNPVFLDADAKAAALTEIVVAESRLAELKLRVLAAADDVAAGAGARDAGAWLAHTAHLRRGDVAAWQRLAHALESLPAVAAAMRAGRLNPGQAEAIVASLADLPRAVSAEVVADAEAALVGYADDFDATALRRLGRRILEVVAPDVAEAAEAEKLADLEAHARQQMRFGLRAGGAGLTRVFGLIPDADAARLATYLHAFTNPRHEPAPAAEVPPAPYGLRTAQAFCQLLECLDPMRLPIHGGDATTLVVTIGLDSLRSALGTATLSGTAPGDSLDRITAAQARRLACTAQLIPAVLGAEGEVLDLGRAQRLFTRAQRRALLLRDQTCRAEGCDIPGPWAEAHHLRSWSQGGATDLGNAVLLCRHHHHRTHAGAHRTERLPNGDVRFHRRC